VELLKKLDENIGDVWSNELMVLMYEFKDGVNKYLSTAHSKMKSLADVIAFNKAN
jgi:amidase